MNDNEETYPNRLLEGRPYVFHPFAYIRQLIDVTVHLYSKKIEKLKVAVILSVQIPALSLAFIDMRRALPEPLRRVGARRGVGRVDEKNKQECINHK
jgi:hypothetical protein